MNESAASARPRSGFVTAVAWIFIALAGFATLISLLQNIMINLLFPLEEMRAAMRAADPSQPMPPIVGFMFENFQLFFLFFFAVCAVTLASSIGLLLRKNWARIAFIGIMLLGVLWNVAGAVLPFLIFPSLPPMPDGAPDDFSRNFELMMKVMTGFMIVTALAFSVLFGWIAMRLLSEEIRQEFLPSR